MAQARKHIVSIDHAGTYRCVRRSWLCGWDSYLQKSFEHRKLGLSAVLPNSLIFLRVRCKDKG